MENVERQTRDFMNVAFFSQLPVSSADPVKEKCIKLFGIEFGGGSHEASSPSADESDSVCEDMKESVEVSRRFECHYCCRNFPTSQALGGHQNAHKRERQHAKRVELQATAATATALMHYRPDSAPVRMLSVTYPSWNRTATSTATGSVAKLHGNRTGFHSQLPTGMWRIPPVQRNFLASHRQNPLHSSPSGAEGALAASQVGTGGYHAHGIRYGLESESSREDHVCLDLRL